MATVPEGGRGSLLTRLQQSNLIKAGDKIVYRGSEGQEFEGDIIVEDGAVYIKFGGENLKNEAAFVRKATGDSTIPKNFKNTLTIGGAAFRDVHDNYKKLNPRAERPAPVRAEGSAPRAARRSRRPNVRLGQLAASGKLTLNAEAWFESKAGRLAGVFVENDRRVGFKYGEEIFPNPAAFIRGVEQAANVAEADRIAGRWDQTLHVGELTIRQAREQYLAERPPPQPRAAAPAASSSSESSELAQIREQIKKLRERERELLAQSGAAPRSRPNRGRRSKGEQTAAQ